MQDERREWERMTILEVHYGHVSLRLFPPPTVTMGKLNIAHHKSYHPYRRDNIERVRRDEEEAALQEAKEEGRLRLADSEARMDVLRERAGAGAGAGSSSKRRKERPGEDLERAMKERDESERREGGSGAKLPTTSGHINFFEDLEAQQNVAAAIRSSTKARKGAPREDPVETDRGVPLAPSKKDLKPWYTQRNRDAQDEGLMAEAGQDDPEAAAREQKRMRDAMRKNAHDPLTAITHQLAARSSSSPSSSSSYARQRPRPRHVDASGPPEVQARLSRESSERERAQALIRQRQREMRGSETPSTVYGGRGYSDVFNPQQVEEAHAYRGRPGQTDYRKTRW
ncbi:Cir-N domain-containing protein [Mycena chlorophos]|uniref:Cir-N domain-containing protein n=1 Tax=Mycena chlorophos TaxID=658473 RepID=A0A8H6THC5_MYCCL|nr:Cir-N domain-containing protein [Mycena chlorophos]